MSLHDPEEFARIVRGMINIQQHEGWLPECRGATAQQWIQGGSSKLSLNLEHDRNLTMTVAVTITLLH